MLPLLTGLDLPIIFYYLKVYLRPDLLRFH
ncbi:hypothetical protein HKBW3S03_01752, partial [Candidatus Hakubella thermalkaliphila]